MRIQSKITISFVSLLALALLSLSIVVTLVARSTTIDALNEQSQERLVAIRNIQKGQIENYYQLLQQQITTQASSTMTQVAVQAFRLSYERYTFELDLFEKQARLSKLRDYYQNHFGKRYESLNPNSDLNVDSYLNKLGDTGIALQYDLIANNTHPLGEKDKLSDLGNTTTYNTFHSLYHPIFQKYLNKFGYYDIFIVDKATGNIIYSVYKELDFATSLKSGAYSDSGIAAAFNQANSLMPGETVITDFAAYTPSYEAHASFIATPIATNGVTDAVLIYQIGIDKINQIMTFGNDWKNSGLGETGQSYLVGQNKTLRSEERSWLENKSNFLNQDILQSTLRADIQRKDTTVGLLPIETESASAALAGKSGFGEIKGPFNEPIYSAFTPVKAGNLNWALVVEETVAEVQAHSAHLTTKIIGIAILSTIIMLAIGIASAMFVGRKLADPMMRMNAKVQNIADNLNINTRLKIPEGKQDELSEVSLAINHLLESVESVVNDVEKTEKDLSQSLDLLGVTIKEVDTTSSKQESMTTGLLDSIQNMTNTSANLNDSVKENQQSSSETVDEANTGIKIIEQNQHITQKLNSVLQETASHVSEVADHTNSIASVLDVIQSITEQTSLLALNAAIEAARAGEQGRGFAVVADEVRTLAKRTQESTHEIKEIIERLQQGSNSSVSAMESAKEIIDETVNSSGKVSEAFHAINEKISHISQKNNLVSDTSHEQAELTQQMSEVVESISEFARRNKSLMEKMSSFNEKVVNANKLLSSSVGRFKR